jgi:hypothetical protein
VRAEIRIRWSMVLVLAFALAGLAAVKPAADKKDKPKPETAQVVDTGTFGVMIRGQRVVNETFSIEQKNGVSIIKSQLKETNGGDSTSQKSVMEITSNGELVHYEWNQGSGSSLSVVPSNDFLLERMTASGNGKPAEKPFLMPSSSVILDNNFFIHRELLAWRYLAAACKSEGGAMKCQQTAASFGVLVPQDQTSMSVKLELVGKEKIKVNGTERELLRLNLSGENVDWVLWVDDRDSFKLIKVAIPADNTEIVRD